MKCTIAETTQTFTKMLTLGLNNMLYIMFRSKVSIFVKVLGCFGFQLRVISPQHFDHCDVKYRCRQEYRQGCTTFDLLNRLSYILV